MGGDHGPHVTVPAALDVQAQRAGIELVLVGRKEAIEPHVRATASGVRIHHAQEVVEMHEPPAQALRYKKHSSMR